MIGVKYLSCFFSYNGNYFFKPFTRKKGENGKNKNKSGPQKRFFRTRVFRFLSKGVRQADLGFYGEAGCLHCMPVGGYYIWGTFWLHGFVTLGWSDNSLVGTEQWLQISMLQSKYQIKEISGCILSGKYRQASRNSWLPKTLKTKTKQNKIKS